jgi:hypothetical protein
VDVSLAHGFGTLGGNWNCGLNLEQSFSFVSYEQEVYTSDKPL